MLTWLIWEAIKHRFLNISYLEVISLDPGALERAYFGFPIPTLHLPRLKTLKIDTLSGLRRYISFNPLNMQFLVAGMSFDTNCLLQLAQPSPLTNLTIMPRYLSEPIDLGTPMHISLPLLQELTLEWIPLFLDAVEFDLRCLRGLIYTGTEKPRKHTCAQYTRVGFVGELDLPS